VPNAPDRRDRYSRGDARVSLYGRLCIKGHCVGPGLKFIGAVPRLRPSHLGCTGAQKGLGIRYCDDLEVSTVLRAVPIRPNGKSLERESGTGGAMTRRTRNLRAVSPRDPFLPLSRLSFSDFTIIDKRRRASPTIRRRQTTTEKRPRALARRSFARPTSSSRGISAYLSVDGFPFYMPA